MMICDNCKKASEHWNDEITADGKRIISCPNCEQEYEVTA